MNKFGYETADGAFYHLLKKNSRNHKRYPTEAESLLWQYLKGKGLGARFRFQHPIGLYIPDFVCLSRNLVVEIDGGYHFIGDQPISDEKRTAYLESKGFRVIRFTNEEVLNNLNNVLETIKKEMNKIIPKSSATTVESDLTRQAPPSLGGVGGGLIIVSAPSGSGKSTIVNWLRQEHPELRLAFSISCTSRPPRGQEQNGVEYFFISPEEFRERIGRDEFLEYEEVYENRFYGTLKEQVERQLAAGQNVVFDVDVKGGINIKKFYGTRALSIFIQPPSVEELRRRLEGRKTDSPEAINERIAKAEYEMTFAPQFDRILINDDLETAKQEALEMVREFLAKTAPASSQGGECQSE